MNRLLPAHLLLVLSALLLGCGSEESSVDPEGVALYQRLELVPLVELEDQVRSDRPTAIRVFDLSTEVSSWEFEAESVRMIAADPANDNAEHVLRLDGENVLSVTIPGPLDLSAFNQIEVIAASQRDTDLVVALLRDGETLLQTPATVVRGNKGAKKQVFELSRALGEEDAADRLVIAFSGSPRVELHSVRLLFRPWIEWLPDQNTDCTRVEIGGEARLAKALSKDLPLGCEFDGHQDAQLSFSFGCPEELRGAAERGVLSVTLFTEDGLEVREERALDEGDQNSSWHSATIALDAFGDRRIRARFEYNAAKEGALCALGTLALVRRRDSAPTVVLVTSDTHRADHLGAAKSGVEVSTPFLDSLAARGILFEDCTSAANVTTASHVALMTGRYPRDTGMITNLSSLSEKATTLAERFREGGYVTYAAVSAQPVSHRRTGLGQGFDRASSPVGPARDSSETFEVASSWLDDAEGLPLFLWIHIFDAHEPYRPPGPYRRQYYPEDRDPENPGLPEIPAWKMPAWAKAIRDLEYVTAMYRAEVTYLDERLRLFLDRGRFRAATIAVTADHGESLLGHELYFNHSGLLYPDTISVPLILTWPDAPAGTRIERPVRQIDLGRTLLDLAELRDVAFPGRSLLEEPSGESSSRPRFAVSDGMRSAAILVDDWYLVLGLRQRRIEQLRTLMPYHAVELYNTAKDPGCQENLAEQEFTTARELRRLLVSWLLDVRGERWTDGEPTPDRELLNQMAELGYTGDGSEPEPSKWFDPECDCEECRKYEEPR